MGDQSGRIYSKRVRVDHVTSDHQWSWYLLYIKCFCVLIIIIIKRIGRLEYRASVNFGKRFTGCLDINVHFC